MRIALTGSSSTGKTTLANALLRDARFKNYATEIRTINARNILAGLGYSAMDKMTREESRYFQLAYYVQKEADERRTKESFITERSFVDVAAYWIERDTYDRSDFEQRILVDPCAEAARTYDIHIYLPFGGVPFSPDGWRSEDRAFHERIDRRIRRLLEKWELPHIAITSADLSERVSFVLDELGRADGRT
ncbi:AAA family ATPase [Streptomyces sp. NPDC058698]|uniref:AAA family ATPase n=1 Tax=Streptomyces sp. NPDC058698 TaxID=3346606 RepID=UPI003662D1A2